MEWIRNITSEKKLFLLHYSMTDYIDWRMVILFFLLNTFAELHLHIFLVVSYKKSIWKSLFIPCTFTKNQIPVKKMRFVSLRWSPGRPEARCFSDIQLPSGNKTLVIKLGWLFLFCIVFIFAPWLIIPDSLKPSGSRFSTAVVAETNLQTGIDREAKVNLFGSSGLHSQNEKPNPTYIGVGALLQSQSWKPIKPTITLLCGSADHSFYSFQPLLGSWGAFNIFFSLFDLEYLTIFQKS